MKLVLLVTLMVVLYAIDFSNSAAIQSEEFAEKLRRIVHEVYSDDLRTHRVLEGENDDQPERICYDAPCGWNAYSTSSRRATVFTYSTCKCPDETYKCVRTGENVASRAYVYHCRQNTTADDFDSETIEDRDYVS